MDTEKLKDNLTNLTPGKDLPAEAVTSAIILAGQEMAWLIDIPELNYSGDPLTVVSGTVDYALTPSTGEVIDRITSAVFVGSSKSVLNIIDINSYDADYRGQATSGTPYECCFYDKKLWLYYIPNSSGSVYYRAQSVFNDFSNLAENYQPLVFQLTKRTLLTSLSSADPGRYNAEIQVCDKLVDRFLSTFKTRVRPYKAGFEIDPHRAERVRRLNAL